MERSKTNAVRGRLGELKMSISTFSEKMGISPKRTYALINGERPYNAIDIEKACKVLGIPAELIPDYFFGTVVPKGNTQKTTEED